MFIYLNYKNNDKILMLNLFIFIFYQMKLFKRFYIILLNKNHILQYM